VTVGAGRQRGAFLCGAPAGARARGGRERVPVFRVPRAEGAGAQRCAARRPRRAQGRGRARCAEAAGTSGAGLLTVGTSGAGLLTVQEVLDAAREHEPAGASAGAGSRRSSRSPAVSPPESKGSVWEALAQGEGGARRSPAVSPPTSYGLGPWEHLALQVASPTPPRAPAGVRPRPRRRTWRVTGGAGAGGGGEAGSGWRVGGAGAFE
jgi:hypothetical protein